MDRSVDDALPWRIARRRLPLVIVVAALATARVDASPNVELDDPAYDELDVRVLRGQAEPMLGGLLPLTEARLRALLPDRTDRAARPDGWWSSPTRSSIELGVTGEDDRPYSTAARPRDVAGHLALSCEGRQGLACGDGGGLLLTTDVAGGHGDDVSALARVRVRSGRGGYATDAALDRGYVNGQLGPVAGEIGRDVLVLGPSGHTQLGWGSNAPPLDHLRISGVRPYPIGPVQVDATYVLGRLAAPQTYPGDLVSITRLDVGVGDVHVGAMQLLQLDGDGAPGFGLWDFLLEHVRRRDASASATDSSNRRVGADVAVRIAGFGGARITYQLMFEDWRKHFADALRYDADHVLGFETRWFLVEGQKTGVRSYEHVPRLTGFTSGGLIVGDPLGPDATSLYAEGRIRACWGMLVPWAQVVRAGSDRYEFVVDGPILPTQRGPVETRWRVGDRARLPLDRRFTVEAEAALEYVSWTAFVPNATRFNGMLRAALVWRP